MLKFISILLTREFKKINFIFFILIILFVSLIVCYFSYKDYSFNNHQNIVVQNKLTEDEYYEIYSNGSYNNYLLYYESYVKESMNKVKLSNLFSDNNLFCFENIYKVQVFLSVFSIVIGSSILLSEYKNGTIKLFLNVGASRFKVFLSFLISCIFLIIILNLILFLAFTLFLIIFNNSFELFKLKVPIIFNDDVIYVNYYLKSFLKFILNMLPVIFIGSFSFFISIIFLSQLFSLCLSFFLNVFGLVVFQWLLEYKIRFLMYSFIPYLDYTIFDDKLNIVLFNIEHGTNLSIFNGNVMLMLYFVIAFFVSLWFFLKRDVN